MNGNKKRYIRSNVEYESNSTTSNSTFHEKNIPSTINISGNQYVSQYSLYTNNTITNQSLMSSDEGTETIVTIDSDHDEELSIASGFINTSDDSFITDIVGGKVILEFDTLQLSKTDIENIFFPVVDCIDELAAESVFKISEKSDRLSYLSDTDDFEFSLTIPSHAIMIFIHEEELSLQSNVKFIDNFFKTSFWQFHHSEIISTAKIKECPENNQDYYISHKGYPLCSFRQIHCGKSIIRFVVHVSSANWKNGKRFYILCLGQEPEICKPDFCLFTTSLSDNYDVQLSLKKTPQDVKTVITHNVSLLFRIYKIGDLVPLLPNCCTHLYHNKWRTTDFDGNVIYFKVMKGSPVKGMNESYLNKDFEKRHYHHTRKKSCKCQKCMKTFNRISHHEKMIFSSSKNSNFNNDKPIKREKLMAHDQNRYSIPHHSSRKNHYPSSSSLIEHDTCNVATSGNHNRHHDGLGMVDEVCHDITRSFKPYNKKLRVKNKPDKDCLKSIEQWVQECRLNMELEYENRFLKQFSKQEKYSRHEHHRNRFENKKQYKDKSKRESNEDSFDDLPDVSELSWDGYIDRDIFSSDSAISSFSSQDRSFQCASEFDSKVNSSKQVEKVIKESLSKLFLDDNDTKKESEDDRVFNQLRCDENNNDIKSNLDKCDSILPEDSIFAGSEIFSDDDDGDDDVVELDIEGSIFDDDICEENENVSNEKLNAKNSTKEFSDAYPSNEKSTDEQSPDNHHVTENKPLKEIQLKKATNLKKYSNRPLESIDEFTMFDPQSTQVELKILKKTITDDRNSYYSHCNASGYEEQCIEFQEIKYKNERRIDTDCNASITEIKSDAELSWSINISQPECSFFI